mmetsp:Transcript_18214/g.40460  ORF Transcript_18214/g.40460 Transcript_18214/m.40460 type:complete len:90 (-) Transcript_18214:1565-1834(-)
MLVGQRAASYEYVPRRMPVMYAAVLVGVARIVACIFLSNLKGKRKKRCRNIYWRKMVPGVCSMHLFIWEASEALATVVSYVNRLEEGGL